jgi:hypothetical protein
MSILNTQIAQSMQAVDDAVAALSRGDKTEAEMIRADLLGSDQFGSAVAAEIICGHLAAYAVKQECDA